MTDNQPASPQGDGPSAVSAVAVKPAPFWREDPDLWFDLLESQFTLANISVDNTMFTYVISVLDHGLLKTVSDVVRNPPANGKYAALKGALISRLSASASAKINSLLEDVELGDRPPSQFYRELKDLAGDSVTEDFLKTLWMKRLPQNMQQILTCLPDGLPILAECADKIAATMMKPNVFATTIAPPEQKEDSRLSRIEDRLDHLTILVQGLCRSNLQAVPRSSSSGGRSRRRTSRSPWRSNWCWYHSNFKDKARSVSNPAHSGTIIQ